MKRNKPKRELLLSTETVKQLSTEVLVEVRGAGGLQSSVSQSGGFACRTSWFC